MAATTTSVVSSFSGLLPGDPDPGRYGCTRGHSPVRIDDDTTYGDTDGYQLRGALVGYFINSCSSHSCSNTVVSVTNLRTHRRVRFSTQDERLIATVKLTLAPAGVLYWTTRDQRVDAVGATVNFTLHRGTASGSQTVIDTGPELDPTSLAIAGNRVYWTNGSEVRTR